RAEDTETDLTPGPALATSQLPDHRRPRKGHRALAKKWRVQKIHEHVVAVELEDGDEVQGQLKDEEAGSLERDASDDATLERGDERADRTDRRPADRTRERNHDPLPARSHRHVGRVDVGGRK